MSAYTYIHTHVRIAAFALHVNVNNGVIYVTFLTVIVNNRTKLTCYKKSTGPWRSYSYYIGGKIKKNIVTIQ